MGKPKNIESPEQMWELFLAYREEVKAAPITVKDWVGGMAKEVTREKEKPLTMEGFSTWLFEKGVTCWVHDYFINRNGAYSDYSNICSRIKEVIRKDQIEGGMAGIYNPSITQRLNGLVEKTDNKSEGKMEVVVTYENKNSPQSTSPESTEDS